MKGIKATYIRRGLYMKGVKAMYIVRIGITTKTPLQPGRLNTEEPQTVVHMTGAESQTHPTRGKGRGVPGPPFSRSRRAKLFKLSSYKKHRCPTTLEPSG